MSSIHEILIPDILQNIFQYINPIQRLPNVALVCRIWNTALIELNKVETKYQLRSLINQKDTFPSEVINSTTHPVFVTLLDTFISDVETNLKDDETVRNIHPLCIRSSYTVYFQQRFASSTVSKLSYDELYNFEHLILNATVTSPFWNSIFQIIKAELPIHYANVMRLDSLSNKMTIHELYAEGIRNLCSSGHFERAMTHLWNLDDKALILASLSVHFKNQLNPQHVSSIFHLISEKILDEPCAEKTLSQLEIYNERLLSEFLSTLVNQLSEEHLDAFFAVCEKMQSPYYCMQIIKSLMLRIKSPKLFPKLTSNQIDIALKLITNGTSTKQDYALALQAICSTSLNSRQIDIVLSLISELGLQQQRCKCVRALCQTLSIKPDLNDEQKKEFSRIVKTLSDDDIRSLNSTCDLEF